MTQQEWLDEVRKRIAISEGSRNTMYLDSQGIKTIGIGFNLERGDAQKALVLAGCSNPQAIIHGTVAMTDAQIAALFAYSFAPVLSEARGSLASGVFDTLADPRRFVVCDMVFNLGINGWMDFTNTRLLINEGQEAKNAGNAVNAHLYFGMAADEMQKSAWYEQVGDRAKRNCAMMRSSIWCDPNGNGSDVLL